MKPVILAGGTGSRLWPKSRAALPKQFLSLTSDVRLVCRITSPSAMPVRSEKDLYVYAKLEVSFCHQQILLKKLHKQNAALGF